MCGHLPMATALDCLTADKMADERDKSMESLSIEFVSFEGDRPIVTSSVPREHMGAADLYDPSLGDIAIRSTRPGWKKFLQSIFRASKIKQSIHWPRNRPLSEPKNTDIAFATHLSTWVCYDRSPKRSCKRSWPSKKNTRIDLPSTRH